MKRGEWNEKKNARACVWSTTTFYRCKRKRKIGPNARKTRYFFPIDTRGIHLCNMHLLALSASFSSIGLGRGLSSPAET